MLWLTLLLTSLGVVALGRILIGRGRAPLGRLTRQLRLLLWGSWLSKVALALGAYLQGALWMALMLLGGAGLTLLEFAWLFRWLYPLERAQRGVQASPREYLAARLRLVWDALAPVVAGSLGALTLVYTASDQYRAAGSIGGLIAIGMGTTALLIGLSLARYPAPLPVRAVPVEAHLLNEARRIGRLLGVEVRAILVLDGARLRSANAFALSGGRIALTDYLLASLTEQETLAVIAHEVAHLAQRRRLVRLWLLQLVGGVALGLGLAPLWEQLPSWGLLLWLIALVVGMLLPATWMRQRHEREADDFAVSLYGATPLRSALLKIATLHQRETHAQGDAVHPSLQRRLAVLERHSHA
ncbi:MAG: M48 family metalloprotease [Fimbriimonadales bacterium]|nr:M48 family metalloprotease [Fimbriimonadales bacterium]